jgi:hypothetical protein
MFILRKALSPNFTILKRKNAEIAEKAFKSLSHNHFLLPFSLQNKRAKATGER